MLRAIVDFSVERSDRCSISMNIHLFRLQCSQVSFSRRLPARYEASRNSASHISHCVKYSREYCCLSGMSSGLFFHPIPRSSSPETDFVQFSNIALLVSDLPLIRDANMATWRKWRLSSSATVRPEPAEWVSFPSPLIILVALPALC